MMEQVKTQIREIKRQRVKGWNGKERNGGGNRIEISFPSIVEVNVRREILQPV